MLNLITHSLNYDTCYSVYVNKSNFLLFSKKILSILNIMRHFKMKISVQFITSLLHTVYFYRSW